MSSSVLGRFIDSASLSTTLSYSRVRASLPPNALRRTRRERRGCHRCVPCAGSLSLVVRQRNYHMKHSRGSCVCAAVRYELITEPLTLFCCHCTECQTASGASFVLALKVRYGGIEVIQGEA